MSTSAENILIPTAEDIVESLHSFVRTHDQLRLSRDYFRYVVVEGVVKLIGHVKTPIVRSAFREGVLKIAGVNAVDDTELYDDETIARSVGKVLPAGVRVRLNHGSVALSGSLPAGALADELMADIGELPGVRLVSANFS